MKDPGPWTDEDWTRAREIETDFDRVRLGVHWSMASSRYKKVFKRRYPIEFAVIEGVLKNDRR